MRPIAKDFFRGMGKSRGKFISVFFIVLLGAAFFSGLRCSQDDMLLSAEKYYDASALMDIRVVGTAGLTDADVRDIGALSVTERAEGGYSLDVIGDTEEKIVVKLISYSENINLPSVTEGKLPASEGECMLDAVYAERYGYRVGDTVSFVSGTDTALSAQVCRTSFTVVGLADLPYYMDLNRGTGSVGNGEIKGFVLVRPETFLLPAYTEISVTLKGARETDSFGKSYETLAEAGKSAVAALRSTQS